MCGIAGVLVGVGQSPPALEELRRMVAMLGHRGPDGYGLYRDTAIGLGHARLSLVDLAGAFQPLRNGDGSIWLSFNGEVFNYVELRRRLMERGHRFYTQGDGEVIIHAYEEWGADAWAMFNGQFAFALWDSNRRRLWLVRDRLGIVPLVWAPVSGAIVFASEAKAVFAGGRLSPSLDGNALAEAFTLWSVMAPGTAFTGLQMVRPATALCFGNNLQPSEQQYWQPDRHRFDLSRLSPEQAADGLEEHLRHAVRLRLRADVPVGCYISGGLDSSVIGALARGEAPVPPETFGIRFDDPRFDEGDEQRQVVEHLGTHHHTFVCDSAAIRDALPEVVWHCETPLLRTSPVPLYLLAAQVRAAGMKTVLTGEGADELLAGYSIFKEDQIRRFWARQPNSHLRPLLLSRIHHEVAGQQARTSPLWRRFFTKGLEDTGHPFYSHLLRWTNTAWALRLLAPQVREDFSGEALLERLSGEMPAGWDQWDPLTRAQWTEVQTFMTPWLLSCQGDRVAMAHGVEARYPFLDPTVIDWCLALPKRQKLLGLRDKLALRRLAGRLLPAAIGQRRKQPFRAPIGRPLFGPASPWLDMLAAEINSLPHIDADTARLLVDKARRQHGDMGGEREEMALVGLLSLALLARQFGTDFAARARQARRALDTSPPVVMIDRIPGDQA
jgi:asparagine synthase (glutamine-hydrolysing)